ncbi:MAG TPA: EcsC family protein [Candidatus Anaerotruncus excrementipullorum]|uniref:EcsC family protein n=1 Tax=Candidatus Anaerotruncus excrementipullorum TaxID=2838465 RepID=A0A9D1WPR9_9FIRM|nr:EcsC family protein [Candidatus Anaerotruncus excrementipullorum]
MLLTTAEGVGLGVLGVGLPDIVLFIGMVLKGIYEIALHYGYAYDSDSERYLILKLIATSMSKGPVWETENQEVDKILLSPPAADEGRMKQQIEDTARLLAMDMLVLKFIQGLPLVGVVGGAFNPVYYRKILHYARLKYYKRYLKDKLRKAASI